MNDDVKKLLNSLGALSELCAAMYQNLLKSGFNPNQALALTQTFLSSVLLKAGSDNQ